jgi:hypothetical protein
MPEHHKKFNTLVARPRVLTEIAFGIWKGRFPYFRCARMNIRSAEDLKKLLGYIEATLVIHNMFITTTRSEDLFIQVRIQLYLSHHIVTCPFTLLKDPYMHNVEVYPLDLAARDGDSLRIISLQSQYLAYFVLHNFFWHCPARVRPQYKRY